MSRKGKVSRFNATNCDVDALRQHYAETLKPVLVNPINGQRTISARDLHISIGEFDVWAGNCPSGMSVSFTEPPDLYALYVPLAGAMEFKQRSRTIVSAPGALIACDLAKVDSILLQENRSHIGVAFSRDAITRQLAELIDAPVDRNFDLLAEISAEQDNGSLATMCGLVWSSLEANPDEGAGSRSNEMLLRAIMVRLLESVPHKYSHRMNRERSPAMPRHVKIAIEFMVAHVLLPLTIDEIATAAGVSARSLQLAFQEFKGTTPLGYLRRLRLENARQDLMVAADENESVGAIAKRWGFSNVARFSTLYKNVFGETPRQTAERQR